MTGGDREENVQSRMEGAILGRLGIRMETWGWARSGKAVRTRERCCFELGGGGEPLSGSQRRRCCKVTA